MDGEGLSPLLPGLGKEPGWIPLCIQGPNGGHLAITQERKSRRDAGPSPPAAEPGPPCVRPAAHRKFLGVFGHSNSAAYF